MVSESLSLRVDVEGTEVFFASTSSPAHLRATSVPDLESAFQLALTFNIHRRHSSNKSCLESTSSHSHAKEALAKTNSTTRPRRCTAPHRRDLPHRKPIPKRPVGIHHDHPHGKSVSTPTFFSIRSPNLGRLFALPELSSRFLTLVPVLSRPFPLH